MGEVRYRGRTYKDVESVVISGDAKSGEGSMTIYDKIGATHIIALRGFQKQDWNKEKRYRITGIIDAIHLEVGNCLDFKGLMKDVSVGNIAACSKNPGHTSSRMEIVGNTTYYRDKMIKEYRMKDGKRPRFDVIHLNGVFERIEVSLANVECHVECSGTAETVSVGNVLNLDGMAERIKAGNRIYVYEQRGSYEKEKRRRKTELMEEKRLWEEFSKMEV